jgi:ParG
VSHISKVEEPQVKRMNLNVPIELHNRFKSVTASQGQNMTDVLLKFIQDYVDDHGMKPSKKGKRS